MAATPLCLASPPTQLTLPASSPMTHITNESDAKGASAMNGTGPLSPTVSSTPSIAHLSEAPSSCLDDVHDDAPLASQLSTAAAQQQPPLSSQELQQQHPAIDLPHLFLICGLCRNYFGDEPKLLSCLHTYCASCLQASMPTGSLSVSCHACKAQTIVPADGIGGFQTNFYVVALKKILEESPVCGGCRGNGSYRRPFVLGAEGGQDTFPGDSTADSTNSCAQASSTTTPASYRCTECAESLCSICAKTHALKVSENRETGESKSHDAVSLCRLAIEAVADGGMIVKSLVDSTKEASTLQTSEALDTSDVVVDVSTSAKNEDHDSESNLPTQPKSNQYRNDPSNQLICPSHDYRLLDLYCTTCETGICHLCADRSHFEHDVETLVDAIGKERLALKKMADDVEARVPLVEETIDQVFCWLAVCAKLLFMFSAHLIDPSSIILPTNQSLLRRQVNQMKESLRRNLDEAECQINSTFDSIVRSLVERRDRLLHEAAAAHEEKQHTLKKQRDALEGKLARILSCAELTVSLLHPHFFSI